MGNVIDFQKANVKKFVKDKNIDVNELLLYETVLYDTSTWSRERLKTAYTILLNFINTYDQSYDLYAYLRQEMERGVLTDPKQIEFYNTLLEEIEDDEMTDIYKNAYEDEANEFKN